MKKLIIAFLAFVVFAPNIHGQSYNWADSLSSAKQFAGVQLGWEYSAVVGLHYGYKLPSQRPIVLQANVSAPFGQKFMDDFKSKIGLRGLVLSRNKFRATVAMNGVYKQYSSELVKLSNLGIEAQTEFGFYHQKWFLSGEIGIDISLTTHFKHTETYKQNIYSDVVDGWYAPISGGFLNFGLQTGYSFQQSDLIFKIGFLQSISSDVNALVPYYTSLSYYIKLN